MYFLEILNALVQGTDSSSVSSLSTELRCYRKDWCSAQDLYSGRTGFESPPGHGLSCLLKSVIMP